MKKVFLNTIKIKNNSFSLVELMVVIAIIGILSAIAVPSYRTYMIKAQVIDAISFLKGFEEAGNVQTQTLGSIPTTINFGGMVINNNSVTSFSGHQYIINVYYKNNIVFNGVTGQAYCVFVQNINIPGINPVNGYWGTNNAICISEVDNGNGIFQKYCGQPGGVGSGVPLQYLPSACSCVNLWQFAC
jgi:prepilin-type N-terminal cleavage/methylation domain-containing protein